LAPVMNQLFVGAQHHDCRGSQVPYGSQVTMVPPRDDPERKRITEAASHFLFGNVIIRDNHTDGFGERFHDDLSNPPGTACQSPGARKSRHRPQRDWPAELARVCLQRSNARNVALHGIPRQKQPQSTVSCLYITRGESDQSATHPKGRRGFRLSRVQRLPSGPGNLHSADPSPRPIRGRPAEACQPLHSPCLHAKVTCAGPRDRIAGAHARDHRVTLRVGCASGAYPPDAEDA
jgi:hypothetical protein